ncbi:MAG: hypothetical protein ATN35_08185 [Epulopiscium sp. Nele67-Bin004]|nr:MAG: hypothetical protein ATN35_08185 [Epulopiscium sp. Nele67-Bin004]
MIKMFVFDLDGTLLTSDQQIDENTTKMLNDLHNQGKKIVIATGRSHSLVEDIVSEYNLTCDLILNNGHELHLDDKVSYIPFSSTKLLEVMEILAKYNMYVTAFGENNKKYSFLDIEEYYNQHILMSESIRGYSLKDSLDKPLFNKQHYTKNFFQVNQASDFSVLNILKIDAKNLDKETTKKCLQELEHIDGLLLSSSYEAYIEVIQDNAHKGIAVLELASRYGIMPDEICAFGDSGNDIEMLQVVTHSFAMANASDKVKSVAKYVTDTNNNQGVFKGIQKIIEMEN